MRRLSSAPPLTLRQTGPHTVHLVSTAAGPLGGDRLELDLDVAPHTTLELGSVASTLVLPGDSELLITARVGAGATLRFTPEPTVLSAGCAHRLHVRLTLEGDASVLWREEIIFGRYGELPGRCHARFDATHDGRPLLRQEFTVGDPTLDTSPAVFGTARCVGTTFLTHPRNHAPREIANTSPAPQPPPAATTDSRARRPPHAPASDGPTGPSRRAVVGDGVAVLPLAGPGTLVSALAADAVQLRTRLLWGERIAGSTPAGDDSVAVGGGGGVSGLQ